MGVITHLLGGTTSTSTQSVAQIEGSSARFRARPVAAGGFDSGEVASDAVTPDARGTARFQLTGLRPNTQYDARYEIDGEIDESRPITFRTFPVEGKAGSFRLAATSCAGHPDSESGYSAIGAFDVSNIPGWVSVRNRDALMTIINGDWGYPNTSNGTVDAYRNGRRANLMQPNQQALWDNTSVFYVVDDHDSFGNDSDGTAGGVENWKTAWREQIPDYPLPDDPSLPLFKKAQIARTLIIGSEERSARTDMSQPDGPNKTMMGADQLDWFRDLFEHATQPGIIWVSGSNLLAGTDDTYDTGFAYERGVIYEFIRRYLARGGVAVCDTGNIHKMFIDNGSASGIGLPVGCFGPMDSHGGSEFKPKFSESYIGGYGCHGTFDVQDDETGYSITMRGWVNDHPWRALRVFPGGTERLVA